MGNQGNAYLAFSGSRHHVVTPALPEAAELGQPNGDYREVGGAYERGFSGGAVVVDPTDETITVDLGKDLRTADGRIVGSVTLRPHTAMILTTP